MLSLSFGNEINQVRVVELHHPNPRLSDVFQVLDASQPINSSRECYVLVLGADSAGSR